MRIKFLLFANLVRAELICDYDENCDRLCAADVCDYFWNIEYRYSNSWQTKGPWWRSFPLFFNETADRLEIPELKTGYTQGVTIDSIVGEDGERKRPEDNLDELFFIDGFPNRRVITVNGQFPGPKIHVKKGSTMRITIKNQLQYEGVNIHWHGLHMIDNFWNDGAMFVSQCPIPANTEFTYIVRADNSGTHWWHSHAGTQRLDGLFGPLIVLEPEEIEQKVTTIPLTIGDWYQTDSISFIANDPFRLRMNEYPGNGPVTCATPYRSFFGGMKVSGLFCLDSFVVNGRGQFRFQEDTSRGMFSIGERYLIPKEADFIKLKVINTGFEMLSAVTRLDGETFNVTATDGRDIVPEEGDVLFLGVGETYDLHIPLSLSEDSFFLRFWLPVDHIGQEEDNLVHEPYLDIEFKRNEAIPEGEFQTELFMRKPDDAIKENLHSNSAEAPIWLNCPFPEKDVVCKTISDFKRLLPSDYKFKGEKTINLPENVSPTDDPDVIINFHVNFMTAGSSVNGIHFKYPSAPFFNGTDVDSITRCTKEELDGSGGVCTQIMSAKVGDLVELRLSNLEKRDDLRTFHSVHMHGYEFFLMATGYAEYDVNGTITSDNADITCGGGDLCPFVTYDEQVLKQQREERGAFIAKNAILVPPQGYTIVRFRASNPGIWPIHCHQGAHLIGGMSALIEIKDETLSRPYSYLPEDFPRCGNFKPSGLPKITPVVSGSPAIEVYSLLLVFLLLVQ